jgi:hypothetical protein
MRELKKNNNEAIGKNFEHVEEWVAITLRHLTVPLGEDEGLNSFY